MMPDPYRLPSDIPSPWDVVHDETNRAMPAPTYADIIHSLLKPRRRFRRFQKGPAR